MGLTIGVDIGGTKIAAGVVDEEGTFSRPQGADSADRRRASSTPSPPRYAAASAGHEIDGRRHRRRRIRRRQARHGPLRAEHRLAPRAAQGQGRAARRPAGRRRERRQRRRLGRVQVRRRHRATTTSSASRSAPASAAASSSATSCAADASAWPPSSATSGWCPDGLLCGCGSQGCWEQYASGRALVRYAKQRANATPENAEILLGLGDGTPEGIEGKHISEAARQGDPVAVDSFRELARWAGAGLADLASLFDPSAFIVGGGVSDEGDLVLDPIRKSFRRWLVGGQLAPARRRCSPPNWAARRAWWARRTWPARADPATYRTDVGARRRRAAGRPAATPTSRSEPHETTRAAHDAHARSARSHGPSPTVRP